MALRASFCRALQQANEPSLAFWVRLVSEGRKMMVRSPTSKGFVMTNIAETFESHGRQIGEAEAMAGMAALVRTYVDAYGGVEEVAFAALSEDITRVAKQRGVEAPAGAGCAGVIVFAAILAGAVAGVSRWLVT